MVESVIDKEWLWVTAQKNNEKGLVLFDFVDDAVSLENTYNPVKLNISLYRPISLLMNIILIIFIIVIIIIIITKSS